MSSVSSWLPVALILEGFSVSLLVFVFKALSLVPLLPAHITPIFLDPFSLSPPPTPSALSFPMSFWKPSNRKKNNPFPSMSGHKTTTQLAHNSWCYINWPLHYSYGLRVSRSPLSVLNPFAHSLADSAKLLISVRTPSAQCIQSAFKSAISPELIFSRY